VDCPLLRCSFTNAVMVEYGSLAFQMPKEDSNSNGVYDWLERDLAVDATISGYFVVQWPSYVEVPVTAVLQRYSGNNTGNFSYSYSVTTQQGTVTLTSHGTYRVAHLNGDYTYNSDGSVELSAATRLGGATFALTGTGSQSFSGDDKITLSEIQLSDSVDTYTMFTSQLERTGNVLQGGVIIKDGDPDTFWDDFRAWYVRIEDGNDHDSDSIPDIVDPPPAPTPAGDVPVTGWHYHAWPWVYSIADQGWLYLTTGNGDHLVWRQADGKWFRFNPNTSAWEVLF
jgi:hypothetical protein